MAGEPPGDHRRSGPASRAPLPVRTGARRVRVGSYRRRMTPSEPPVEQLARDRLPAVARRRPPLRAGWAAGPVEVDGIRAGRREASAPGPGEPPTATAPDAAPATGAVERSTRVRRPGRRARRRARCPAIDSAARSTTNAPPTSRPPRPPGDGRATAPRPSPAPGAGDADAPRSGGRPSGSCRQRGRRTGRLAWLPSRRPGTSADVAARSRDEALAAAAAGYTSSYGHPLDHPGEEAPAGGRRWWLSTRHAVVAGVAVAVLATGVVVRASVAMPEAPVELGSVQETAGSRSRPGRRARTGSPAGPRRGRRRSGASARNGADPGRAGAAAGGRACRTRPVSLPPAARPAAGATGADGGRGRARRRAGGGARRPHPARRRTRERRGRRRGRSGTGSRPVGGQPRARRASTASRSTSPRSARRCARRPAARPALPPAASPARRRRAAPSRAPAPVAAQHRRPRRPRRAARHRTGARPADPRLAPRQRAVPQRRRARRGQRDRRGAARPTATAGPGLTCARHRSTCGCCRRPPPAGRACAVGVRLAAPHRRWPPPRLLAARRLPGRRRGRGRRAVRTPDARAAPRGRGAVPGLPLARRAAARRGARAASCSSCWSPRRAWRPRAASARCGTPACSACSWPRRRRSGSSGRCGRRRCPVRVDDPVGRRATAGRVRVDLAVEHVAGRGRAGPAPGPVLVLAGPRWRDVAFGARVEALRDARADRRRRHRRAPSSSSGARRPSAPDPAPVDARVRTVRLALLRVTDPLPPDRRGLVPGAAIGDTSRVPADLDAAHARRRAHPHHRGVGRALRHRGRRGARADRGRRGAAGRARRRRGRGGHGRVRRARPPDAERAARRGDRGGRRRGPGPRAARSRAGRARGGVVVLLVRRPLAGRQRRLRRCRWSRPAGIVLGSGPLAARAGARLLPERAARVVAVPLAAQCACGPVVAAAHARAAALRRAGERAGRPAVAPATVLGVLAALLAPWWEPAARACAAAAGWAMLVDRGRRPRGRGLPGAQLPWPAAPWGPLLLAVATAGVVLALVRPWRRARPRRERPAPAAGAGCGRRAGRLCPCQPAARRPSAAAGRGAPPRRGRPSGSSGTRSSWRRSCSSAAPRACSRSGRSRPSSRLVRAARAGCRGHPARRCGLHRRARSAWSAARRCSPRRGRRRRGLERGRRGAGRRRARATSRRPRPRSCSCCSTPAVSAARSCSTRCGRPASRRWRAS